MTNSEKEKEYKKQKIFKYLNIFLSFSVIVLEAFALFNVISCLWGAIPFILNIILKYIKDKPSKK